jgi:two-component system, NarL family, response regulator NreC
VGDPTPPDPEITVVLADDHNVMRTGLRMLLDAEQDLRVVAEARNIETTYREVRGHRPTVLVLDLNMPGGSSIAAIPSLAHLSPRTSIVVLTMEEDPVFVGEAMRAGAHSYVLKHAAGPRLVSAIRAAAEGPSTA